MENTSEDGPGLVVNRTKLYPSASYAPWYKVPGTPFVSVEHPYIIKNIEKGLELLGGPNKLRELVQESEVITASLYLRPGDRMSRPIQSTNVATNNVVLKVTVPKRTGLKRRRGSQAPYLETNGESDPALVQPKEPAGVGKDTQYLVRAMCDNPIKCRVQPVGTIDHTHRFRGMPDFVFSSAGKPFMQKMQEHILPFEYEKMKGFSFNMSKGVKPNTEIIPPPRFTHFDLPFNYSYRQNPSVKQVVDELGNTTTVNVHLAPKTWNQPVPFDIAEIPFGPADIPPVETLSPAMQRLIASAKRLMEERPIFTRRALMNSIPGSDWETVGSNVAKYVYQYVGYMFASGPWRDGVVRFGVDPRKDPECRKYQTMMFMLEKEAKDSRARWTRTKIDPNVAADALKKKQSHLFDGQTVSKDGKVWQVCDITDPFMKDLLATTNLRKECDIQSDGWYHNGTWAKVKIIMKYKISDILEGMPSKDASYVKVARGLPDIITRQHKDRAKMGEGATSLEISLATAIRASSLSYPLSNSQRAVKLVGANEEEWQEDGEEGRGVERRGVHGGENVEQEDEELEEETQDEDDDEEEEEEEDGEDEDEIEMPLNTGDGMIDPRLTEIGQHLVRLESSSGQMEGMTEAIDKSDARRAYDWHSSGVGRR